MILSMYKAKSPWDPIIISDEDAEMLEKMMEKNEKRTGLTQKEKELLEGSMKFDGIVKNM